jgi:formylglycine-generating enzyme required for sulfatase activity
VRLGGEDVIDAASGVTAAFGGTAAGYLHFTEPLDGMVLFEDDAVRIEVVTGYVTFDTSAIVSGDFKEGRLVSFDFDGWANLFYKMDLQVRAKKSLELSGSRRILPPFRKFLGTVVGGVPVWVELVVELKAGFEAEAEIAGTILTGVDFRKVTGIQVRLRDGNWTHSIVSPDPRFEPTGPEWQIEGAARARVFLEPKATFYLESLAGPSVNLMSYLELAGEFQSNPLSYDWALYGGLTSQLALEVRGWNDDWGELPSWTLFDLRRTLRSGKFPQETASPAILSHPVSVTAVQGGSASFSVSATGSPAPSYQWFFKGERIPGATSPTLVLNNVTAGLAGTYFVQVSNPQRTVTSQTATLIVQGTTTAPSGMALIPAGPFEMGDSFNEGSGVELPVHTVYVSAFYADKLEVTRDRWDEVYVWAINNGYTFDHPGSAKAVNHPVHSLNWYDGVKWCNARSERDGLVPAYYTSAAQTTVYKTGWVDVQNDWVKWNSGYRLPTEAEWEKAARGGLSRRRFPWGDTISHSDGNYYSRDLEAYDVSVTRGFHPGWVLDGILPFTSIAGSFPTNDYGLYDIVGNVSEWCWDWVSPTYYSNSPKADPHGPTSGVYRILRGGSWKEIAVGSRTSGRYFNWPVTSGGDFLGFRTVLSPNYLPIITGHPQSRMIKRGDAVAFTVEAIGATPLGYQWYKDGTVITNATNSTLALTNVQTTARGSYSVVVSNKWASAPSLEAVLTVVSSGGGER